MYFSPVSPCTLLVSLSLSLSSLVVMSHIFSHHRSLVAADSTVTWFCSLVSLCLAEWIYTPPPPPPPPFSLCLSVYVRRQTTGQGTNETHEWQSTSTKTHTSSSSLRSHSYTSCSKAQSEIKWDSRGVCLWIPLSPLFFTTVPAGHLMMNADSVTRRRMFTDATHYKNTSTVSTQLKPFPKLHELQSVLLSNTDRSKEKNIEEKRTFCLFDHSLSWCQV